MAPLWPCGLQISGKENLPALGKYLEEMRYFCVGRIVVWVFLHLFLSKHPPKKYVPCKQWLKNENVFFLALYEHPGPWDVICITQ